MTPESFDRFRARLVREYAADKVAAGNWPEEGSLERSETGLQELLNDGPTTAGHSLWTIEDETGRDAGDVWVGPNPRDPESIYIYDIEVRPDARGRGIGQGAMEALEAWARSQGYPRIGLQVFGSNDAARRLYHRLGYVETNVLMQKTI
jgi:ribosomal protein S18 acetylase RimI-like enzyme